MVSDAQRLLRSPCLYGQHHIDVADQFVHVDARVSEARGVKHRRREVSVEVVAAVVLRQCCPLEALPANIS